MKSIPNSLKTSTKQTAQQKDKLVYGLTRKKKRPDISYQYHT